MKINSVVQGDTKSNQQALPEKNKKKEKKGIKNKKIVLYQAKLLSVFFQTSLEYHGYFLIGKGLPAVKKGWEPLDLTNFFEYQIKYC
jgi:hypothetical protein